MYGQDSSVTCEVFKVDIEDGHRTQLGGPGSGGSIDFTDYTGSLDDYLVVKLAVAHANQDTVFGGVLLGADGSGTQTIYANDFSSSTGWTLDAPVSGVGWAMDSSPALVNGQPIGAQARKLSDNDVVQLAGVKMGFFAS